MAARLGDVINARIHFIDQPSVTKERPAVVISTYEFNSREGVYVVVPLTGTIQRICDYDVHLSPQEEVDCGLTKLSVARPSRITTIVLTAATHKSGKAPKTLMDKVYAQIRNILGITSD